MSPDQACIQKRVAVRHYSLFPRVKCGSRATSVTIRSGFSAFDDRLTGSCCVSEEAATLSEYRLGRYVVQFGDVSELPSRLSSETQRRL